MKVLLACLAVIICASVQAEKKKGAGYEPFKSKTAVECFEKFDKLHDGNCQGGFVDSCQDCDMEKCAEKCFFEHRNCKGFSYSNMTTPSCVLKEIAQCDSVVRNQLHTFYTRDMECNLLPSGGLYPSMDGCAFAQTAQRCNDILAACDPGQCQTEEQCLNYCARDPLCHGATWDVKSDDCGLWLGRECDKDEGSKYDIRYFEKYCGKNLEKFEKKRLDEYKERCQPQCPNVPVPSGGLHTGGSNEIGDVFTVDCMTGTNQGPAQMICEKDGDLGAKWVPLHSDPSLGTEPRCVVGAALPDITKSD